MTDRTDIRTAFAGLLTAALVGEGKPVKQVYAYRVGDFKNQTPVIALGSGGTERTRLAMRGKHKRSYFLDVFVFVLYALQDEETEELVLDADNQPVWMERDAEDLMDALEQRIGELIEGLESNRPLWESISYANASQPEVAVVGGLPYYLEVITLRFGQL